MAKVTQNPVSPIHIFENGDSLIYLDGKAFSVSTDTIKEAEITSAPGEFRSLALAQQHFHITNEGLTWYNGSTRIKYIAETKKFYINNSEVLSESFQNHLIATGLVNYALRPKVQLFEFAANNFESFVSLDFVEKVEEGQIKCYVMKLDEAFFVYRMNEANRIYNFSKLNANECFDYIKEQTGHEITSMTAELLEGERVKAKEKAEKIALLEQMIAFLKDQRGVLAEADKSIEEIREADALINSEIKRLEEEIQSIKEGKADQALAAIKLAKELEDEENESEEVDETVAAAMAAAELAKKAKEEDEENESEEVDEAESDATDSDTMEDGEEAGEEAEEMEKDAEDVDSDEEREAEGEEADQEAPEASGEDAKDDVAGEEEETETPEDESTGDQDDEVEDEGDSDVEEANTNEDEAEDIEDAEVELGKVEKSEEDQEELEASYDEAEKKTNEAGSINRADGYVPATLNRKTEEFAEGTEMKVDAEDYTTSGSDENITAFIGDQPTKIRKSHISLANTETI